MKTKDFIMFIALCLIIYLMLTKKTPEKVIEKQFFYDTTIIEKITTPQIIKEHYFYHTDSVREYFPEYINKTDTDAILNNFFTERIYNDTLKNDSIAFINIIDTVFQNRILSRKLKYINRKPTSIIIQETPVFLTGGAFYMQNSTFNSIGLKAGLTIKKNTFSIGYGTSKTFYLDYSRELFRKKGKF